MMPTRIGPALAALALLCGTNLLAQKPEPRVGKLSPEIDFKTFEGLRVKLSELRGRAVVVTFWASYCPPCREEFPALEVVHQRYRAAGLAVFAVNQTTQERRESVATITAPARSSTQRTSARAAVSQPS